MANQEQLDILKKGAKVWNEWREEHPNVIPDLGGADLSGAHLSRAHLSGANLDFANLREANLDGADLSGAGLSGADLSGAELIRANLRKADLDFANLREVNLGGANLSGAHLVEADLSGAHLREANLREVNLSGAHLSGADLSDALVTGVKYLDRKHDQRFRTGLYARSIMRGNYQGIRVASCYGNANFKRDAEDQDFLDTLEFQWKGTWRIGLFRAWGLIDYGRSMLAAFVIAFLIVMVFGLIYLIPGIISYGSHYQTWFSPFYFSIMTFTTLGSGGITPNGVLGEIIVSLQVICGYLTLGLLISILANKVARRS